MGRFDRDSRPSGGSRDNRGFGGGSRGGFGRDAGRPTQSFPAVCAKCGKDCTIPFRPSAGRPVYCSNCFERPTDSGSSFVKKDYSRPSFNSAPTQPTFTRPDNTDLIAKKLELLSSKLDLVLQALTPKAVSVEVEKAPAKEKKVEKVKTVAPKATKPAKKPASKKK